MDNKPSTLTPVKISGSDGADDPARLREEIAETRNEMSGTIEQLHGRLNPVVLKEQAIEQFHEASDTIKQELKERLQEAKESLLAELKDVKETVRVDVLEEIDTVKSRVSDEIVQAKAAIREATIGKVENMVQGTRDRVRSAGRSVKDVVADNPIPALLAGAGLAWLFFEGRRSRGSRLLEEDRRDRRMLYGSDVDLDVDMEMDIDREGIQGEGVRGKIRDVGEQAGRKVAGATKEAASKVSQVAHEAKDTVTEVAQRAQDKASELSREAGERARRVQRRGNEVYRSNPIAIGAAMLAAGTIVGLAVPRTKVENEWLGGARDRVVGKAQELAHKAIDKADEAVKRVGEGEESQGETSAGQFSDEYH